jgi:GH25 family lysozyme M1 (1,4-beta-N-acetylmuramidase)
VTAAAGCILAALAAAGGLGVSPAAAAVAVPGVDVSSHQISTDWASAASGGVRFAYIKATEGLSVSNARFAAQYDGAYAAGLIRGAYHFARPNLSSGAAQASFFAAHGGGWTADGRTLPGALDIEPNPEPHGAQCYGLSPGAMVAWISEFVSTYRALTSRWPVIYTNRDWWNACTGGYSGFASQDPLWVAHYTATPGPLPAGWNSYTFWQHAPGGPVAGDQDVFNGSSVSLRNLATGS